MAAHQELLAVLLLERVHQVKEIMVVLVAVAVAVQQLEVVAVQVQ